MIKNFITAFQFLTIFRIRKTHDIGENDLAQSMVHFPLVGFFIGFLLVNADKAMALVAIPQAVATFIVIVFSVLVTRALHVDGLADTCDGLMGGHDHASRLAIMKDSRLGTAGALGIVSVLIMKYLCLNNLYESERVAALLIAPALGRWSQTFMVFKSNYGREDGMGRVFVGHLRSSGLTAATVLAAGISAFVVVRLDVRSVLLCVCLLAGVLLLTLAGKRYLAAKLGGVTGDSIGAMNEMSEVLVFFIFVMFSGGN
jgi:adenosylcobinamide-GDP ribazoletransferase